MKIKVIKSQSAKLPIYATNGAACFDFHADIPEDRPVRLGPDRTAVIPTGLKFEIPDNHVLLIFSRSGHGFKDGVRLSNCVGVIDSDYRGEVMIKLRSDDQNILQINRHDRVAQGLVLRYDQVEFEEVEKLSTTDRGESGLGSTGVSG